MRYGTVCSGIEAPSVAWEPLGWTPLWFSEIEKFPKAVLAHHYPDVPDLGDMTKVDWYEQANVDVLIGGTPCQSFSVAGLRKGMADPRGNLALEFLKIVDRKRPSWVVWENVPGVLSSNEGRDFGAFIGGLAKCGYSFCWRILDAQYFGVPQRRRRVFLVASPGDWTGPAAVLFERESLQRNPPPSREKGEGVAGTLEARARIGSDAGYPASNHLIFPTIDCQIDRKWGSNQWVDSGQYVLESAPISPSVTSGPPFSRTGNERVEADALVVMAHGASNAEIDTERSPTLTCVHDGPPFVAIPINTQVATRGKKLGRGTGFGIGEDGDPAYTLQSAHCHAIGIGPNVRRLTTTECERLQGFPDGYTCIPWRGKTPGSCPDGPRYRALGNSMAVPVIRWIGERIQKVEDIKNGKGNND